jgi:K(+)-stimulated pyrophosphate-energized sodium pump
MENFNLYLYLILAVGGTALLFAYFKAAWIKRQEVGTERMAEIAQFIREGAMAFLGKEYRTLAIFILVVAGLLFWANWGRADSSPLIGLSFALGAVASGLSGLFGMRTATNANVRTTNGARSSLHQALAVAFGGGTVMGMSVVGLGVLGLTGLLLVFSSQTQWDLNRIVTIISGFSLGASSIALFARVGGGIYTKAADVGADLVGKVEAGIPEDDPRNPAVIADNVGDNVGDVAGMGADLFESYVGAIVAAMVLGAASNMPKEAVLLPLALAAVGILCSILGTFFVRTREGGNPQTALNIGTFGAGILMVIAAYFLIKQLLPQGVGIDGSSYSPEGIFYAAIVGLGSGIGIGLVTEYYCSKGRGPVNSIIDASNTGPATNIIGGLAVGMTSTVFPVLFICIAVLVSYEYGGLYGIAIAALGMLSTTGIQLAVDAYGPIADNAGGIAEMSGLPKEVRGRTDTLDAVGNTTAAIGKGFAIGSAALAALSLFSAYRTVVGINSIDLTHPNIMTGLFLGGMLPFLFSSMAMKAVARAANAMIQEVRRQFKNIPGLMEGKAKADYARCVEISTAAAIKQMVVPGLMAVLVPVAIGFYDKEMLAGVLAGVTVSGVLLAIFMANAGGAWDNAKKQIEEEPKSAEAGTGKGSERHKAAVIGDTVGDPFKDTAGPSLNILIKLMSVVALVIAPLL